MSRLAPVSGSVVLVVQVKLEQMRALVSEVGSTMLLGLMPALGSLVLLMMLAPRADVFSVEGTEAQLPCQLEMEVSHAGDSKLEALAVPPTAMLQIALSR